jgi:hypothetical protein
MKTDPKDTTNTKEETERSQERMRQETRRFRHQTNTMLKLGLVDNLPDNFQSR